MKVELLKMNIQMEDSNKLYVIYQVQLFGT